MAFPHDDEPPLPTTPPATTVPPGGHATEGDANLDPLTQEPGAHPVGVGVGAAGVGAVGAMLGAVAGPIGLLVGTVVGALTGAAVGKQTAETVNPTDPSAPAQAEEERSATEEPAVAGMSAAPPVKVLATDTGETYFGGGTGVLNTPPPLPPEPMAGPAPAAVAPGGSSPRLRKIVLPVRTAPAGETSETTPPPPLEVTTRPAYPEESVREAAYRRFLDRERTGQPGSELDDWTAAEREVLRG